MKTPQKLLEIFRLLENRYGKVSCPLKHDTPFQLLVAVVLSAQCTDKRVNLVTPELFRRFPDAAAFAAAGEGEIEELVKSCGLYQAKSRNLRAAAKMIVERFGGEVPRDMENLLQLPGIGRKSANVLLGNAFDTPGFPVDTHVKRLLNLLGVVRSDSPEAIEKKVCSLLPDRYWTDFSHLLIQHGRTVCRAGRPDCDDCELGGLCSHAGKV